MKIKNILFVLFCTLLFVRCHDKIEPEVDTLYLKEGDYESRKAEAVTKLYRHYVDGKRDKKYYEVVSKGDFVLNYYPAGRLLSMAWDSGWGKQYKNVDESLLLSLVTKQFTLDDVIYNGIDGTMHDSLLVKSDPFVDIKSNVSYDL